MTTSMPSGLGASFGLTAEGTVGTFSTSSMRWLRFDKESFALKKTTGQSTGLHQGLYLEGKRRNLIQKEAPGAVTLDLADKQLGLVFKHCLGAISGPTQVASTTAYLSTITPADTTGLSLSAQIGRPETNGTIQQFNYNGLKIVDWTISVQRGQLAKLDLTFDGWNETTSTGYAAPSLVAADVYDFSQCVVKLGGTPSTTSSVTSISGGSVPSGIISSLTIKGTNPMKTDRVNIGSQTKIEQLANNFRTIDVEFEIDFANLTDIYSAGFTADTSMAFEATFTGGIAGGSNHFLVDVIIPDLFIDEDPISVDSGPDVLSQKVKAVGLDNGADNQIQIQYQSTDTSA